MKVVFTDRSRSDLRAIAFYIARENPRRAKSFVEHLRAKAREIGDNPSAFPLLESLADRGVRRKVVGSYLIFHQVRNDTVVILRIIYGAREYQDDLR